MFICPFPGKPSKRTTPEAGLDAQRAYVEGLRLFRFRVHVYGSGFRAEGLCLGSKVLRCTYVHV